MTKIDLREAPRSSSGQLALPGFSIVTSQDQNGNETFHQVPNFQRDIKQEIYLYVQQHPNCSTGQIAKAVNLKKTPWLISKIKELVKDGYLTQHHTTWKNGVLMYLYEVASGTVSQADR